MPRGGAGGGAMGRCSPPPPWPSLALRPLEGRAKLLGPEDRSGGSGDGEGAWPSPPLSAAPKQRLETEQGSSDSTSPKDLETSDPGHPTDLMGREWVMLSLPRQVETFPIARDPSGTISAAVDLWVDLLRIPCLPKLLSGPLSPTEQEGERREGQTIQNEVPWLHPSENRPAL